MSLIEELLIRIRTDTSQADTGLRDSQNAADDLTDSLRDTEEQADSASNTLAGFAAKALGALAGALALSESISGAIERAGDIKALSQTADALGVAIDELDAFGRAAEQAGGDAQGARDTLTDMAEKIGEAFSDSESGAAKAFKAIGISVKDGSGKAKDAITGFLELADAVAGLDKSAAVFKIKELGITDNRSVEMILKGRKELERMIAAQKTQGVVTKESAERAIKLTDTMAALKGSLNNASNTFFDMLIPALTKALEWLKVIVDWAGEHKDFIVGFFVAIGTVVAAVYLPAMIAAAAATLAATWPIIAIGAAIALAAAAFALIYDDIMNFIDGNESFIGQVFEKYPMVKDIVMTLIDVFKMMFDMLITGAQQIGNFVAAGFLQIVAGIKVAIDYLGEAYGSISGFVDDSLAAFQSMADGVAAVFRFIVDTIKSSLAFATAGIDKIKGAANTVAGVFGFGDDEEDKPQSETARPERRENQPALPSGNGQAASDVPMIESDVPQVNSDERRMASQSAKETDAQVAKRSIPAANSYIQSAAQTPMNSVTSSAISNTTNRTSETNVQTGDITIQTQATDAQGISQDIGSNLKSELKSLGQETATSIER